MIFLHQFSENKLQSYIYITSANGPSHTWFSVGHWNSLSLSLMQSKVAGEGGPLGRGLEEREGRTNRGKLCEAEGVGKSKCQPPKVWTSRSKTIRTVLGKGATEHRGARQNKAPGVREYKICYMKSANNARKKWRLFNTHSVYYFRQVTATAKMQYVVSHPWDLSTCKHINEHILAPTRLNEARGVHQFKASLGYTARLSLKNKRWK